VAAPVVEGSDGAGRGHLVSAQTVQECRLAHTGGPQGGYRLSGAQPGFQAPHPLAGEGADGEHRRSQGSSQGQHRVPIRNQIRLVQDDDGLDPALAQGQDEALDHAGTEGAVQAGQDEAGVQVGRQDLGTSGSAHGPAAQARAAGQETLHAQSVQPQADQVPRHGEVGRRVVAQCAR